MTNTLQSKRTSRARPVDAARRELILKAYGAHTRRFDEIALQRRRAGQTAPCRESKELAPVTLTLSPRQREVLSLIAQGLPNEDVGAALNVAVDTVKSHVQHILQALGARNRAHAVQLGFTHGFLG